MKILNGKLFKTGKDRILLSDIEKSELPKLLDEPFQLIFIFSESYKSLRKDSPRNPDSVANRRGVIELLRSRQNRTAGE